MQPVFDALEELGIEPLGPEIETRGDASESELIERVVRRAAELRVAWAAEEPETPGAEDGRQGFRGWRRRKRPAEPEVAAQPTQEMKRPEPATTPPLLVQPSLPIAPGAPLTSGERPVRARPQLPALLSRYALKSVDGRSKGDPLYVYADDSDAEVSKQLRALGFTYKRHEKRWWTREQGNL